jgi:hypothetical protein
MDDYEKHEVLLAFSHRGRQVHLNASMPYMLTGDGRRLIDRVAELLPRPEGSKVVALPPR